MEQIITQPDIELFGIRIQEPVTMATDLFVSIICFTAFCLLRERSAGNRIIFFFRLYFISMATATFLGGVIGHGFLYYFSIAWKFPGWFVSMFSVSFIERASIEFVSPFLNARFSKTLRILNIIELFIFGMITFFTLDFFYVEIHSIYGLGIVVAGLNSYCFYHTRSKSNLLALSAIAVLIAAAIVFANKLYISHWFNHCDISHVLMALAAFLFYLSAKSYYVSIGSAILQRKPRKPVYT